MTCDIVADMGSFGALGSGIVFGDTGALTVSELFDRLGSSTTGAAESTGIDGECGIGDNRFGKSRRNRGIGTFPRVGGRGSLSVGTVGPGNTGGNNPRRPRPRGEGGALRFNGGVGTSDGVCLRFGRDGNFFDMGGLERLLLLGGEGVSWSEDEFALSMSGLSIVCEGNRGR